MVVFSESCDRASEEGWWVLMTKTFPPSALVKVREEHELLFMALSCSYKAF